MKKFWICRYKKGDSWAYCSNQKTPPYEILYGKSPTLGSRYWEPIEDFVVGITATDFHRLTDLRLRPGQSMEIKGKIHFPV